ncbi:MAG: hypothetical protein IKB02_05870 [Clostridia bacterium]|nr:hypothetical protein [Clostridia bacterium]
MPTTNEYLVERIAELELELAEAKALYDDLAEHHEETMSFFDGYAEAYEILNEYLKPENHLVTCIIDGEDAQKIAKIFGLKLQPIKE